MTLLAVVILGAGLILLASSLDDTPIVTTFQKIITGQPIDWSGMAGVVPVSLPTGTVTTPAGTGCPTGMTQKFYSGTSGAFYCVPAKGVTQCPTGYMSMTYGTQVVCVPSATTVG